jgi:hypothetical protein
MTTLLDIAFDIDGYLHKGGQLMNLQFLTAQEEKTVSALAELMHEEALDRIARAGRFLKSFGRFGKPEEKIADGVTEQDLRSIWSATEHPEQ